jgi:tetrapyrrole methylase family protein/MazG family protein
VGRKLGVSSESALLATIHKFRCRFAFIEQQAQQRQHKDLQDMSLAEMDELWEQAKRQLKAQESNHDIAASMPQT